MNTIDIGKSGLMGSAIVLGCMRLHEIPEEDVPKVIQTAYDSGITMFDHADIYGAGQGEERFGRALSKTSLKREDILIQTKAGIADDGYDFSKDYLLSAVNKSLKRLNTDYVDILLLHRPDALMEPEEVAEALEALHDSGKVKHFGVSNQHPMQMELLRKYLKQPLIANQLQFSPVHAAMIACGIEVNTMAPGSVHHDGMILDYCRLKDITIQTWSPFQYGHMDGVFLQNPDYKDLNDAIRRIADEKGITDSAVVAAWILRHPAKMQVIIGSMNPERIAGIAKAPEHPLSRKEWYELYEKAGNQVP